MAAKTVLTTNTLEEFRTTFNTLSSTDIGDLVSLTTSAGSIVGAINEVDAAIGTGNFTVSADSGSDTAIALGVDTLTVLGGAGLQTSLSGDTLTIDDSVSGVTAASYGSTTAIPVITVNDKGRITSATTAGITTALTIRDSASTTGNIALATDELKFDGGAGLAASISGDVVTYNFDGVTFTNYEYTATTGQATFSGSDNNGNTLAYTAGKVDVFLNGVRLASSDFTATNGSTIALSSGAIGGDILVVKAFVTVNTSLIEIKFDTTPQLGGNLDVNGNSIVSASNGNIAITPNGSGKVILDGLSHPTSDGTNGQVLTTDGSGNLTFTNKTTDTGILNVVEDTTPQLGGSLDVNGNAIVSASDGNISINPDGTGKVIIDGLSHPTSDGTSGQALVTNGSGDLSFSTISVDVVDDTTPQLGGNLDLNSNDITGTGNITVTGKGTYSGVGSFEALELITSDTNRVYMTGNSSVSGDMWRIGTLNSNPHLNISAFQSSGQILFNTNGSQRMAIDTSGNLKFNSGYGSVATAYGVRAWVFFNGTGTPSISGSGNVSSITDLGTGVYGVNFSTAMPDTNYCPVGIAQRSGTTNSDINVSERHNYTRTTSQVRIDVRIASNGGSSDPTRCNVMVVR
tara:strand:+ start:18687 stop:20573 length:1887 start_codon:yes stop_codon:yes gene_type:complete